MSEYSTHEIASIVGIAGATVRKYAQHLERAGYVYLKNEKGERIFFDKDILVLREFKELSDAKKMTSTHIADMLAVKYKDNDQGVNDSYIDSVSGSDMAMFYKDLRAEMLREDAESLKLLEKIKKVDMIDDMMDCLKELSIESKHNRKELELLRAENRELAKLLKEVHMDNSHVLKAQEQLLNEVSATREKKVWWKFWK